MSSTAKLAADPGSYALEFQPEELYGQLRAEQLHRDYVTACQFIEDTVKQKVSVNTLHTKLQDGIVLCEVLNKLRPGIVKHINYKDLPFAKMENISHFLAAANKLGLKSTDLFQTVDLYEAKNMNKVVSTILTIARVVAGVPFSARRKDSDDAEANKLDSVRRCPAVVQDYHHSYHQSLVQATLIDLRPQSAGVGKDASLFIKGLLTPDASISAHGSKRKGTVPSFLPPVPGQDLASPDTTSSTLRQQRRQNNTATVRTINVAKRIVRNETPVPTGSTDSSVPKNAKPPGTDTSSSHNAYYDPPMSPPLPTLRVSAFDIFKDPPANALAAVDSDLESASKMSDSNDNDDGAESGCSESASSNNIARDCGSETDFQLDLPGPETHSGYVGRQKQVDEKAQSSRDNIIVYTDPSGQSQHYQLGNCIGKGQFGSVYRALNLESGQMVAVKQIPLQDHDPKEMESNEVELLKSLSSPRIVRYYGFVRTPTHLNLIMEYIENGSLNATIKSFGNFPEKLVLAYSVKIIEGLIYLHSRHVVHCDLKAANILTTKKGNTKLSDFGVSLNLKMSVPSDDSIVAGTPNWMAPEIIQLEGACKASDIWSLGCTIIELITGKPPYHGMVQMAALYHIVEDEHPPLPSGISDELQDFLLQCFKKDPKKRSTAEDLLKHPWISQYRRNHKEMKQLRRNHSMKVSNYMSSRIMKSQQPMPFSSSLLDALPMFISKPLKGKDSAPQESPDGTTPPDPSARTTQAGPEVKAVDEEDTNPMPKLQMPTAASAIAASSAAGLKDRGLPAKEQPSETMAAKGSGDTMMTKVVVTANTSPKANRLQRRLKLLPRRRENKESPQKSSDQHQQLVKNSSTAKSARGQDLAALDTPPGRRERSSSMPQPAQAVRVPERMPLNPSRPNLTLEIRLNNAKEAFSQLQASSPTSRTATPTRHITNNSPSTPTSLFPSPQVPPRSAIVPSLPTTGMAVASSSSRSQQSDGGPSSSPSRRADGGYWHESSLAEDGWEIVEPGWRAAVASPSARPSTPHKPPLPGYFAQKQRLPPTQLKPSPSAASLSIAHGSSIDPTWLANNHHHQPSSSPSMATPHSNATGGMPSLLQAKHSAMELSSAADGARGDASATAADEARKKFSARPIPLTTQVAKDRPEGPRPLGVPVTQSRPTSLPNGFTMDIGRNPFFHSTSDIGMFTAHPNYSTDSDLSVPTLATRVRTMTSRNAAIGGSDGLVRRSPSNASSERSARYAHYRAPSSSSATASASASTYAKPPLYLPAKKAAKRITRECSVM